MSNGIKPLVTKEQINLAMLGMVDGNAHPYSWSAIFNGYNPDEMSKIAYQYRTIPDYLGKQPSETFGIKDARITHIWTDNPADARHISRASLIPHIVERPEDVIGKADAVIICTDIGYEHVERCKPFVEAGLPVFVDKPMVDSGKDLEVFCKWVDEGAAILSSSSMRYCKEFTPYRISTYNLGVIRYASITMIKSWERYGIHALEAVYPIFGPGFISVRNTGTPDKNIVHLKHSGGADIMVITIKDLYGASGVLQLCGTAGYAHAVSSDGFYSFKAQLESFIHYLRTGVRPFPFSETVELMKILIAGIKSREEGGCEVLIDSIPDSAG